MALGASLRKRLSTRNLADNGNPPPDSPAGGASGEGGGLLRPQSAAAQRSAVPAKASIEDHDPQIVRPTTALDRPPSGTWKRFSLLQQKHASDPQLSARYRQHAPTSRSSSPSACPAPVIGVTAPTWDLSDEQKPKRKFNLFSPRQSTSRSASYNATVVNTDPERVAIGRRSSFRSRKSFGGASSTEHKDRLWSTGGLWPPSADRTSFLASTQVSGQRSPVPPAPESETTSTATKRFKLPRRKKPKAQGSLFPLPVHLSPSNPRPVRSAEQLSTIFPVRPSPLGSSHSNTPFDSTPNRPSTPTSLTSPSQFPPPRSSEAASSDDHIERTPVPPPLARHGSSNSAPAIPYPDMPLSLADLRDRSGTVSSVSSRKWDDRAPTPFHESVARTSMTSTTLGRNSIAGLRSFTTKLRHPSELSPRHGSPSGGNSMKNGSFAMSKEAVNIPDREEGESAAQYYGRLETAVHKREIGQLFSKSADQFSHDVLRSLLRTFKFYEEPMDISLRRFLWEVELPAESQQIDRVLSAFAQRYLECNTTIFDDADEVYLLAFSLVMLHSDVYNQSNKRKMQRHEYQLNTRAANVDEVLLGYFYDNIQYTEFINQRDSVDDDVSSLKSKRAKARKKVKKITVPREAGAQEKVDPYDFILGKREKLDSLRPALKGVLNLDDTYHYFGTAGIMDIRAIRRSFCEPAILQTVSSRSRPNAYRHHATNDNALETSAGLVDLKIVKVGLVWRKDPKKKPARSPWQEWGALLTQSQLHYFRNKDWVRDLMKQEDNHRRQIRDYENHLKQVHDSDKLQKLQVARDLHVNNGVVFRPPVQDFKPDHSVKTPGITALLDTSYDKHKHAFLVVNPDTFEEEVLLAENEREMNDWLAKINFASAFTSSKIGIQPTYDLDAQLDSDNNVANDGLDDPSRAETSIGTEPVAGPTSDEISEVRIDPTIARQQAMKSKVGEIGGLLHEAERKLGQQLKTARHLQIIAPFPSDTRSDMLSFGAKCAHLVKWTRIEIWRLKAQRDMLCADLINEPTLVDRDLKLDSNAKTASPRLLPTALGRLNSKASAIINPQKAARGAHGKLREATRHKVTTQVTDFSSRIDEALSPPAELTRSASAGPDGPFKLPPLVLTTTEDRPSSIGTGSMARQGSVISNASRLAPTIRSSTPPAKTSSKPEDGTSSLKKRPSTAMETEKDQQSAFGSPSTRAKNRRSLQRTLRDSKEIPTSSRSRRGKDSISSAGVDDKPSTQEQLSRKPGSFTLHGKKASVITVGPEFQHLLPEERLRARKQALALEDGAGFIEPSEEDDTKLRPRQSSMVSGTSRHGSSPSLLEAPIVGSDGSSIQYLAKDARDPVSLDQRRYSTTSLGTTVADSDVTHQDLNSESGEEEFFEPAQSFKQRLPGAVQSAGNLSAS